MHNSRLSRWELSPREPSVKSTDLTALLRAMCGRHSSNPVDKVCAISLPFQKRESHNYESVIFPMYDPSTPVSAAWEQLISSITSTKMEPNTLPLATLEYRVFDYDDLRPVSQTPTVQLLRLFPHPSRHHWFPSWAQVQQYPDVSVRENDSVPVTEGMDCSLRIMSGRIYQGCTLQLIQPPTPKRKAVYRCTMEGRDGRDAQLVATVPGIELDIDPRRTYVLIDISPDRSLWPEEPAERCRGEGREWYSAGCREKGIGHEHLPIWQESVIIICQEVGTPAQPTTTDTARTTKFSSSSSSVMRRHLRRVTTLEWDCRLSAQPGPGRWLPFEPSLVHIRSVACSACPVLPTGRCKFDRSTALSLQDFPDVFCDPAVILGWKNGDRWWDGKWDGPVYEVYLV